MKFLVLALCLVVSVCTYHIRHNVVVTNTKIVNHPWAKYKLDKIIPIEELVKKGNYEPKGMVAAEAVLNDFGDQIFANVQNALVTGGMDPMSLPDVTESFEYTLIITYTGEFDLRNGWLSDISTIHRGGDLVFNYDNTNKYLTLRVPIAFNDLAFTYDYSASIMGLGPDGYVDGKVVDVQIEAIVGFSSTALVVSLDSFSVTHAGSIDLAFHGSDLIDWLLDILSDLATTILHDVIVNLVEGLVNDSLQQMVDSLNQALDDFLNPTTAAPAVTPPIPYIVK